MITLYHCNSNKYGARLIKQPSVPEIVVMKEMEIVGSDLITQAIQQ